MPQLSYRDALNEALREEMERDERVFVMGEEVAFYEGSYKVTKGLLAEFGPRRVKDTPIAEEVIVGSAIGAAMGGLRPVAELMTVNFGLLAMDQIVNHAAKIGYMFNGHARVPLVIRTPQGSGKQLGAQHSQQLESYFCHCPGLIVLAPSTPADAKGLLKTAIRDENPIIFMISSSRVNVRGLKEHCRDAGLQPIAVYDSLPNAFAALNALNRHRLWQAHQQERTVDKSLPAVLDWRKADVRRMLAQVRKDNRDLLTTAESLALLQTYDIQVAPYKLATTLDEAFHAADELGYPLALKLNSKTITHKTEVGGVQVDLRTPEEVRTAFDIMMAGLEKTGTRSFSAGEGIMVQTFMPKGRELILGVKTDPDFGKLILIGRGGIDAEIDRDTQVRLNPLTHTDVGDMISGIRAYKILKGYRGKPGIDFEALEQHILRLSQLMQDFPEIQELDINPYMALSATQGRSAAVDARIILSPPQHS